MPDITSGLGYPQPQNPNRNENPLGQAASMVEMMRGLQELKIRGAQQPALEQQPAAVLQGQQLGNQQSAVALQAAQLKLRSDAINGYKGYVAQQVTAAGDKANEETVLNAIVNAATRFNIVPAQFPEVPIETRQSLFKNGKILDNAREMYAGTLSPELAASRVSGSVGPSGEETMTSLAEATGKGPITKSVPQQAQDQMFADQRVAGRYGQDMQPLNRALELVKQLGAGSTGPGTEGRQKAMEFLYAAVPGLIPESEKKNIQGRAELEKYLINDAQSRAESFGPHTNAGLSTSITGSPNVHINDLAVHDLLKARIALRKMEQATIVQSAKGGALNYPTNRANISGGMDPRAFATSTMAPEEIAALHKSLKGAERRKFNESYSHGVAAGVISPPGQ
jgi:hypothetical protein